MALRYAERSPISHQRPGFEIQLDGSCYSTGAKHMDTLCPPKVSVNTLDNSVFSFTSLQHAVCSDGGETGLMCSRSIVTEQFGKDAVLPSKCYYVSVKSASKQVFKVIQQMKSYLIQPIKMLFMAGL